MKAAIPIGRPPAASIESSPARRFSWTRAVLALALAVAIIATAALIQSGPGMRGKYAGADGRSAMEFRGHRVYITTVLGTTFVANYEVDGNHVIIKGAGGAQVYTRAGDTLDGGVGIKFVKMESQAE